MQLSVTTLYKNHGAKIGYWTATALATADGAEVRLTYAKTMDGKPVTKVDPIVGKNIGRANETTPQQQAMLELESRVNKQLDKGYVRTLEDAAAPATNALGLLKPMLAQPIDKVKPDSIDWENAYFQPKVDGHRCLFKNGVLYSRNGKELALPHIVEAVREAGLDHLHLDGELYIHGRLLQDIGSLIKRPRIESLALQYHVYDTVLQAPYRDRYGVLADVLRNSGVPQVLLVETKKVTTRQELDQAHRQFLREGYEGTILRHGLTGYQCDKRSQNLLKIKQFEDGEFRVVGVERGTPNGVYEVPVWVLDVPGVGTFKATAAGTQKEKNDQWQAKDSFIGRLLTVQHFGCSKSGVPLLPVALRWREDV